MSLTYKQLMLALERDEEWSISRSRIHHDPSGIAWWIANGLMCFGTIDSAKARLGVLERWLAYRAAMRMIDRVTARKLAAKHA